jgi:hypothetical protein
MGNEGPQPLGSWRRSPPSLSARLAWLGIASAALDLASVYWKTPAVRAGVTTGDLVDLATPVLLVVLYALVLRELPRASRFRILVVVGGIGLLLGHGVHAAANSIHDAIDRAGVPDPGGLVNWWDERLSHVVIHGSKALMWVGLVAIEGRGVTSKTTAGLVVGALAYGFITFAEGIEGQTVFFLLPFVILFLAWSLGQGRDYAPVRLFYTLAAVVAILLFASWGILHHGFPEFSQVGLIPRPR